MNEIQREFLTFRSDAGISNQNYKEIITQCLNADFWSKGQTCN